MSTTETPATNRAERQESAERGFIRAATFLLRLGWRSHPTGLVATFILTVAFRVVGPLIALWARMIISGILERSSTDVFVGVGGLTLTSAAALVAGGLSGRVSLTLREKVGFAVEEQLVLMAHHIPTIECWYDSKFVDRLAEISRRGGPEYGNALTRLIDLLSILAWLTAMTLLLLTVHPLLVLLLPAGLIPVWASGRASRRTEHAQAAAASPRRTASHLLEVATSAVSCKEVKVLGLSDEVRRRRARLFQDAEGVLGPARRSAATMSGAGRLAFAAAFGGALLFVATLASRGAASAADVVIAILLAGQVHTSVGDVSVVLGRFRGSLEILNHVLEAMSNISTYGSRILPDAPVTTPPRGDLELRGVSYSYPGTRHAALRDVDLVLRSSSVIALVGENGAGKTTLAMILSGLIRPTEGSVAVAGDETPFQTPQTLWQVSSAVFQDHCRFEMLLGTSIGVGDLEHKDERWRVLGALARAGGRDLYDQLPDGLDSMLGASWPEGTDLSEGQWRVVSLARSLMRRRSHLFVCDEPTAGLDPETEAAFFRRLAMQTAAARRDGGITILISHRLTSTKLADTIAVLHDGRIVELGSHDDLLAAGGRYAELYQVQSEGYA